MNNQNEDITNLKDYCRIIYKRKISIIAIFLIIVVAGTTMSISSPKTFEAKGLLRVGEIRGKNIESIDETKKIFNSDAVLRELINKLNLPSETITSSVASRFDIASDQKTGFLEVKGRGGTPEKALKVVNLIIEMIIERHQAIATEAQTALEEDIEQIQRQIKNVEATMVVSQKAIKDFETEVRIMQKKIEGLIEEKGIVSEGRGLIIQAYMETWQNSRDRLRDEESKMEYIKTQKEKLEMDLREKKLQKAYDNRPTKTEVSSVLPQTKIAPNNRQNVKIAGFLGLFLGILYAFGAEYVGQNKSNK